VAGVLLFSIWSISVIALKMRSELKVPTSQILQVIATILVLPAMSGAEDATDKELASKQIGIADWSWQRGGFDTVMIADFLFTNNSPWAIKDVQILCVHSSSSGTVIDKNRRTIFEVFPAHSARWVSNFNMGYIHSQAATSGAKVEDFEFVQPHLSKETIDRLSDIQKKVNQDAAAALKSAAEEKRKAAAAAALKFNQEAAARGDAYGLLRMGERYRDGDGVEKDLAKAREYFGRAAKQGNSSAAAALAKLPTD
jgi:hypothetical protein